MLNLDPDVRAPLWQALVAEIERYFVEVRSARVAPVLDPAALRRMLAPFDFERTVSPLAATDFAVGGLWRHQVHTPHPRYFGLFNPAPTAMGVVADALVAAFNPQMAAWSHNPFATEMERHLIEALGGKFGYAAPDLDGVFASGGAEANHTALLCALTCQFPDFAARGVRSLDAQPTVYVSAQSHDSVLKAARLCGLGSDSVRVLPVDASLRLAPQAAATAIAQDRERGFRPAFLVATAGTTSAGVIDPLALLAEVAAVHGVWFHVDAAWGGSAAMVPELRGLLAGIERADSLTFDAHKSLSVPMAAGVFLTRHREALGKTFRTAAGYMPLDAEGLDGDTLPDPFAHSIAWSRRFIGLKLFLSLAVAGWEGYAEALRHQVAMAELLRAEAEAKGWKIVNDTRLPLVLLQSEATADHEAIARRVVASGAAWISAVKLPRGGDAIRACITNYRTQPDDVRALVSLLERYRV